MTMKTNGQLTTDALFSHDSGSIVTWAERHKTQWPKTSETRLWAEWYWRHCVTTLSPRTNTMKIILKFQTTSRTRLFTGQTRLLVTPLTQGHTTDVNSFFLLKPQKPGAFRDRPESSSTGPSGERRATGEQHRLQHLCRLRLLPSRAPRDEKCRC